MRYKETFVGKVNEIVSNLDRTSSKTKQARMA